MNKPIQYLLVGFPYSGKTTLAKELLKLGNFAHINIDELKWARGYREEVMMMFPIKYGKKFLMRLIT